MSSDTTSAATALIDTLLARIAELERDRDELRSRATNLLGGLEHAVSLAEGFRRERDEARAALAENYRQVSDERDEARSLADGYKTGVDYLAVRKLTRPSADGREGAVGAAPPSLLDSVWVVRHRPSDTWWRANRSGYTSELVAAGAYTREEAEQCARTRSPHIDEDGRRYYDEEAMPLRRALKGLSPGTVGAAAFGLVVPVVQVDTPEQRPPEDMRRGECASFPQCSYHAVGGTPGWCSNASPPVTDEEAAENLAAHEECYERNAARRRGRRDQRSP